MKARADIILLDNSRSTLSFFRMVIDISKTVLYLWLCGVGLLITVPAGSVIVAGESFHSNGCLVHRKKFLLSI